LPSFQDGRKSKKTGGVKTGFNAKAQGKQEIIRK